MNQKLFILLLAIIFFGGLILSTNVLPAPAESQCPDPAPYCDKGLEMCIFNQDTQMCACSCCDDNERNCYQNYPS
ncbi:hypothetical protein F8M41_008331 [Gigaspora margarita]|uniref:Uncharacterized protein n=2 Tax=Gigaspora margarita TaxID=4874 RepID=A0A8H3X6A8_GIGMA|nr:hypothetical protein F8M41_008331 [Gigaspora margarita]